MKKSTTATNTAEKSGKDKDKSKEDDFMDDDDKKDNDEDLDDSTREKNNAFLTRKYVVHIRVITRNNVNNYAYYRVKYG